MLARRALRRLSPSPLAMGARCLASEAPVAFDARGPARLITLNRPKALNALNLEMVRSIYPALLGYAQDDAVSLVIIKGAGEKAFCAGGDVRSLVEEGLRGNLDAARTFFQEEYVLNHLIRSLSVPYVALVDGIVMGGGVGLSVHGRFRVATERSLFAMPETAIGLFPDVGGGYFLPRLRGWLGMYVALSGARLRGWDLVHAGVATHFVPSDALPRLEDQLCALPKAPDTSQKVETLLREFQLAAGSPDDFSLAPYVEQMDAAFSAPSVQGILEALERDPSDWAAKTRKTLAKMSPTSMAITHRQLREGGNMNLARVLEMENRMGVRVMEAGKDFFDGVRAVLIDKDNAPRWSPGSVSEVSEAAVEAHFARLSPDKELSIPQLHAKL